MKLNKRSDLKAFFDPSAVAVFGSLKSEFGLGYGTIKNMMDFGFNGKIYPVNPSLGEVMGLKVYSSLDDIGEAIDMAVVITPAPTVPKIVQECARKGIKAVIVISEHFAEAHEEGAKLQQQLKEITHRTGIRIMGPNTVGVFNTSNGLMTTPYPIGYNNIRKGSIAYCAQSGFAAAQTQPLEDRAYPISKMCDLANKCDVNEVDILNYLAHDSKTRVVAMHMEDIKDGRRFMDAARNMTAKKPLIIFKTARSQPGSKASISHTGSLAGRYEVYAGAIRQVGAVGVDTWQEFWDVPKVFALQSLPGGNRVAIFVWSGGVGVVAADAAVEAGLVVTDLSSATMERLAELTALKPGNPVDISPMLSASDAPYSLQKDIIETVLDDPNVDCAIFAMAVMGPEQPVTEMIDHLVDNISKPVAFWLYGQRLSLIEDISRSLERRGVPTFIELQTAVKALGMLAGYSRFISSIDSNADS
jgi:acyl-CoA synthetase (NDP forming)